ncbi:hypothetical protein [Kribbella sindirgiensis]|uniref:Uncharacterized protein n=1 Tax=Kribbella sindirgiensis TaxID=1124744 RepID=A0A4R0JMW6_9ACTN|nr:hypothetical protein [Kribbella sindirgiensis]TCC43265.1 hypothetical protein E0H50_01940 [Kribbella sindirgiensis]
MIDPRNTQSVVDALGQSPLDAIGAAVRDTRTDLKTYRTTLPAMAARHSQRGILNWVHDQFFAHVRAQFEANVKSTKVLDREPTRDIFVGQNFRFRFKKHASDDMVSSYPTDGFLAFALQDPPQLIQEIRLIGGYRWDPEIREIGTAVLSARDGKKSVLWVVELAETAAGDSDVVHFQPQTPDTSLPALPQIVESVEIEKDAGSQ